MKYMLPREYDIVAWLDAGGAVEYRSKDLCQCSNCLKIGWQRLLFGFTGYDLDFDNCVYRKVGELPKPQKTATEVFATDDTVKATLDQILSDLEAIRTGTLEEIDSLKSQVQDVKRALYPEDIA